MTLLRWASVGLLLSLGCNRAGSTSLLPDSGNQPVDGETPAPDVQPGDKPAITSFTAAPATLAAGGGQVTLSWSVAGADTLVIDPGVGAVTGTSKQVMVTATTIFTLSATNASGTSTKSALVTVGPASTKPTIVSFSAMPAVLPTGGGMTTLKWQVLNGKTLAIDQGVGTVTGDSTTVNVTATTIYKLTATNDDGTTEAVTAVVIGQNPARHGERWAVMMSPTGGETFTAPATLRVIAAGRDPNINTNSPVNGRGGNASKMQFFIDDNPNPIFEQDGSMADYWIFQGIANGIAAGQHRIWGRAIYVNPAEILDSPPALIDVAAAPAYDKTVTLDADVVLMGSTGYELVGAADKRIRLNGNGFKIRSAANATGPLTLKFVDLFDVGDRTAPSSKGIDVTTTGTLTIEDSIVDTSNPMNIVLNGTATASVRRNLFRSNTRTPVGGSPDGSSESPSNPLLVLGGTSTGAKVFAANNIASNWVEFTRAKNWVVGGTDPADANILNGPRIGIFVTSSTGMVVRGNFARSAYYGGWSQGNNFELGGVTDLVVEHNIVIHSSWPARGVGCEFRYNLILDAGHQWLWPAPNALIHHNVFVGGPNDIAGIYVIYKPDNVSVYNNTIDAQLHKETRTALEMTGGTVKFNSNAVLNVPRAPSVMITGGTLTADYNAFSNPQTTNYSDGRKPAHDVGPDGAQVDFKLTDPIKDVPFDFDEPSIWKRATTVHALLTLYRNRYLPKAGSPLIDAGDPAGGTGNDIGAVGAGEPNASDKFGLF